MQFITLYITLPISNILTSQVASAKSLQWQSVEPSSVYILAFFLPAATKPALGIPKESPTAIQVLELPCQAPKTSLTTTSSKEKIRKKPTKKRTYTGKYHYVVLFSLEIDSHTFVITSR